MTRSTVAWSVPGYTTGTVLSAGNDLVVETSAGPAYSSNTTALLSVPVTGAVEAL